MRGDELTPQQRRFVELYARTGNATQAALQSGYARRSAASQASRLLRNGKIREYLDTLQTEAAGDAVADVAEVQSVLSDLLRDPMKPPAARIGAANLLLKSRGAYVPPDEPLPDEKPEGAIIALPWDSRGGPPNAVQYHGQLTAFQDNEDEQGPIVLEYLDLTNRGHIEHFLKWEAEHENTTN
ncbi:MAG: terminase small subunit [Clostridia bacterium]|nr:terminase small subunit [Clostridia bacterium]